HAEGRRGPPRRRRDPASEQNRPRTAPALQSQLKAVISKGLMQAPNPADANPEPFSPDVRTMVLLVDDQALVAEAVRRMLAGQPGIDFHYCADAAAAVQVATRIRPT